MEKAIVEASKKDIVIISSTADQGVIVKQTAADASTIVNNQDLFSIAACNRWGHLLDSSATGGHFSFIGNDVHVGQVPFLKSPETVSGSSVATAIAAGTASLILACCRMSEKCKTPDHGSQKTDPWRTRMVRDAFSRMKVSPSNYVVLENLCGVNRRLEGVDFHETVNTTFQSH